MEVVGLIFIVDVKIQQVKFGINIKSPFIILLICDLEKKVYFFKKYIFLTILQVL